MMQLVASNKLHPILLVMAPFILKKITNLSVMTLQDFIRINQLRPADAIVARKKNIGLLAHYILYLGYDRNRHPVFMANMIGRGVVRLTPEEVAELTEDYAPVRLNPFVGNDYERKAAVNRALSSQDQAAYKFVLQNCEHFANWVQKGVPYSQQTRIVSGGVAVGGVVLATTSENEGVRTLGWIMAGLGLLTLGMELSE